MPVYTKGYLGQSTPTESELEVLSLAANGVSSKEMAHRLSISLSTVSGRFNNVLRKLNALDRAHAVSISLRMGWLDPESARPRPVVVVLVPAGSPPVEVIYMEHNGEQAR